MNEDIFLPKPPMLSPGFTSQTTQSMLKSKSRSRIPTPRGESDVSDTAKSADTAKRNSSIPQCAIPWSKDTNKDAPKQHSDISNSKDTTPRSTDTRSKSKDFSPVMNTPSKSDYRAQYAQLEEALEQIKSLQHENQRLLAGKLQSSKMLDAAARAKEGLQNELAAARKEHFASIKEHITKAAELEQCQQRLNEMAATSKASHATSEIYTRGLASSVATRMAAAKEKEDMVLALQQKDETLQALEAVVTELQGELQALQADHDLSLSQVQQLQEKLAQKAGTITRLQTELQAAQTEAQQKERAMREAEASHEATVQGLHNQLEAQRQEHASSVEQMQSAAAQQQQEAQAQMDAQAQQHVSQISALELHLREQTAHSVDLEDQVHQQIARSTDLEAQLQQLGTRNKDLEAQLCASVEQASSLQQQLEESESKASDQEQQLAQQSARVAELQQQLSLQGARADGLQQQLDLREAHVAQLEEKLAEGGSATSLLEQQLRERTGQLQAQLDASTARTADMEAEILRQSQAMSELRAEHARDLAEQRQDVRAARQQWEDEKEGELDSLRAELEAQRVDHLQSLAEAAQEQLLEQESLARTQMEERIAGLTIQHQTEIESLQAARSTSVEDRIQAEAGVRNRKLQAELEDLRDKWMAASHIIKEIEAKKSRKKSGFSLFCFGIRPMGA